MTYTPFLISNYATGFYDKVLYEFKVSCGKFVETTRRCLMKIRKKYIDITNVKFFKLIALEPEKVEKGRGIFWKCICDCGNKCVVYGGHLRNGSRKSCGCIAQEYIEVTGACRVLSLYKRKASKRNIEWKLSESVFKSLISSKCFHCGSPPSNYLMRLKTDKIQIVYSGIDRIDSSLGYVDDNCVSCCKHCNQSKNDMTLKEWFEHIKKIVTHQGWNK